MKGQISERHTREAYKSDHDVHDINEWSDGHESCTYTSIFFFCLFWWLQSPVKLSCLFSVQHVEWLYIRHELHGGAQPCNRYNKAFHAWHKGFSTYAILFTKSYLYYYQLVHKHRYSYVFSSLPNKRKRELNKYPCILMTQCAGLLWSTMPTSMVVIQITSSI